MGDVRWLTFTTRINFDELAGLARIKDQQAPLSEITRWIVRERGERKAENLASQRHCLIVIPTNST